MECLSPCIISFSTISSYRVLTRQDYKIEKYLEKKSKVVTVYFIEQKLNPQIQTL